MEDRFLLQLKKGVLEMLVLETVCRGNTYGYRLLTSLRERSGGLFTLKEGTLYPILYRLEDEGLIEAVWAADEGRSVPRKMYSATDKGRRENLRQRQVWREFTAAVAAFHDQDEA